MTKPATLAEYIAQVRQLSTEASAKRARPESLVVEKTDAELRAALARVKASPTIAAHLAASAAYRRLGIFDDAVDHASAAIALAPRDAAGYDARARLWRDWGLPQMALADAYRAVSYTRLRGVAASRPGGDTATAGQAGSGNDGAFPSSVAGRPGNDGAFPSTAAHRESAALNTLGTVLERLGEDEAARDAFARAVALNPAATWAHANLARLKSRAVNADE